MIPHRLNLLSPDKKQHLKRMVNFQLIKKLIEISLIFLSLLGITFLGGQWTLESHFTQIVGNIVSANNKFAKTNLEIKSINLNLTQSEKIQKEYSLWTSLLEELSQAIPDNVTLGQLTLNNQNKTLTISGTASAREDLLLLKDNLEKISWIEKADIPSEQLTQKNNIQFSISPTLK